MNETKLANSFLFFTFCLYLYIAGFSYTSLIVDSPDNSFLITCLRVVLIFIMIIVRLLTGSLTKIDVIVFFISGVLLVSLNPFFIIVAFMLIVGLLLKPFVNEKGAINFANYISLFSFVSILILCWLGILENKFFFDNSDYAKSVRYSLGFDNPNATSIFAVQSIMLFFVYNNNFGKILSTIIGLIVIYFAASRTAFIVLLLFLMLYTFVYSIFLMKLIKIFTLLFLAIVPLFIVFFISKGIWIIGSYDLNQLMSGRLTLIQEYYNMIGGVSLFPSYVDFSLDSGVSNILLKGGLIFYYLFIYLCYCYYRMETNRLFLFLFSSFLLLLLSENFITGNLLLSVLIMARFLMLLGNRKNIGNFI
ncbi:hypothetical protein [Acinetobacter sp. WU_MDCI_Abxc22]|uniref:hypothetical protein n=1 Tax=Acinetobacter sp. WU_MDCI_Abxc22 TaxID=2850071 RepID=UPI0021CD9A93|nr:hypothetical protein [Acinetobacter sp. WU_MDCI_Abxc22]MCU4362171.1 hypothetical protein [Acinetobacter sp. WU_MDCI_Abxc22]